MDRDFVFLERSVSLFKMEAWVAKYKFELIGVSFSLWNVRF